MIIDISIADFETPDNLLKSLYDIRLLYNISDRSILDEVINSPNYPDLLKMEAVAIIEEYESDDEDYEDD